MGNIHHPRDNQAAKAARQVNINQTQARVAALTVLQGSIHQQAQLLAVHVLLATLDHLLGVTAFLACLDNSNQIQEKHLAFLVK